MSAFQVLDQRFVRYTLPNALLEKLYTGMRWAEGPVYFADHRCLIFSDIPNDRMLRFDEESGQVTTFRAVSNYSNGNTRDRAGRLVTCEHGTRRVTRTEIDGSITVLADHYRGKRLNSPNDVVVKSDGTVWFTDPSYGISAHYEGGKSVSETGSRDVYRIDPEAREMHAVATDFSQPNGLAFSPDESVLYIADSGYWPDPAAPRHIRAFDVLPGNNLKENRILSVVSPGIPDGLRVDVDGNVWVGAADGVHCIAPDGATIGKILVPETCGNIAFGGLRLNRLYICAFTSLYSIYLNIEGASTL